MIIQSIAFYIFAVIAVSAGVMVISARNPVHSVLFLILAFFSSAGLFVLMGAEFLAMILIINIYIYIMYKPASFYKDSDRDSYKAIQLVTLKAGVIRQRVFLSDSSQTPFKGLLRDS